MNNIIYSVQYVLLGLMETPLYFWLFRILGLRKYKWKAVLILTLAILNTLTVFITNKQFTPAASALEFNTHSNTIGGIIMTAETIIFFLFLSIYFKTRKIVNQSLMKIFAAITLFSSLNALLFYVAHFVLFFITLALFFALGSG